MGKHKAQWLAHGDHRRALSLGNLHIYLDLEQGRATLVEKVITALLYYVGMAVIILAVSLPYREILRFPPAFSRRVTDEHD